MFGTVIIDAYKKDDIEKISEALDDLCSPNDNYGWASAGIYCFWNYYTKEVLYIGLAVDLAERFKQHNGIKKIENNSCKYEYIMEYFKTNEKLGYSIFVQSPLNQPITAKNEKMFLDMLGTILTKEDYVGQQGKEDIKVVEGILIEVFRRTNNYLPRWNKISGSVVGQKVARNGNYEIVKAFNELEPHPLVSRASLRELSQNAMYEGFESFLHAIRMSMFTFGMSFDQSLKFHRENDMINRYEQMEKTKYFEKRLKI